MSDPTKAVVLLSGGIDSVTTAAIAKAQGFDVHALSFRYGQRHNAELAAADVAALNLGIEHHIVCDLPIAAIAQSALTADIAVPTSRSLDEMSNSIPVTYVPSRNIIFLSIASAWAATLGTPHIFIGVNQLDYSGYPDCRGEFIDAFQNALNVGTKQGQMSGPWTIHAPLLRKTKAEIIKWGNTLGVDYSATSSCYQARLVGELGHYQWHACGKCDSCLLRIKGFEEAGVVDPTIYYKD